MYRLVSDTLKAGGRDQHQQQRLGVRGEASAALGAITRSGELAPVSGESPAEGRLMVAIPR
ncbi:MAG TPA: hypothetical protein VLJ88_00120 [Propionibacteriaceae bacterium]|nr:hypothetical protein [Propionibacteriaceae bacterium]